MAALFLLNLSRMLRYADASCYTCLHLGPSALGTWLEFNKHLMNARNDYAHFTGFIFHPKSSPFLSLYQLTEHALSKLIPN